MGPTIFGPTPETLEAQRKAAVAYGDATWGKGPTPNFTHVNDAFKKPPASPVREPVPVVPAAAAAPGPSYGQQYWPETSGVFQSSGPAIAGAYQQGGVGSAVGMTARKAVEYLPAVGNDLMRNVAGVLDPAANAAKTLFTGDPTPINAPAAAAPVAAPVGDANYGNEHRRPLAAGATGTPAVAAPAGVPTTPQQAYDTPGSIFSASKGGKTYTPEQLAAMAGPDNSANVKTPMEIYANEMALNAAMPDRVRGGVIGRGGDFGPRQQVRASPEQANAQAAFFGAAQGQRARNIATAGAQMQLDQQKAITDLHQKILATKDPKTRAALIQDLLALTGKRGGQNPIAVKGGQAIGPDGMTVFSQPEAVFDPNTGAFTYQGGGGAAVPPQQAQIAAIKAQVQAGTMPRDEAVKQLKALGLE